MKPITDQQRESAWGVLRRDYWADIASVADWAETAIADGEIETFDDLHDWLHQTIDGHARVIYTSLAMETLLVSDNASACLDIFGEVPLTEGKDVHWSALAFYAFQEDVLAYSTWHEIATKLPSREVEDNAE